VAISIIFVILNTIFVTLRCYARSLIKTVYGLDDYLIFASLISNTALSVVSILMVYYGGAGRHFSDVLKDVKDDPPGWAKEIFSIVFINMYLASVSLPKLSALFFYLRVFVYRKGRVLAYIVIGLVILNWAVFSITSIFQCRPIAYWWDKTIQGGVCFNLRIYNPAMCVPNIATDVVVLLLPISSLMQLKLPLLKRVALCFIFLTASVGMFASIYRFSVVLTTDPFRDRTWVAVSLIGWSIVESGMYLIAACLPLLRPVIEEKVIPKKLKQQEFKQSSAIRCHKAEHVENPDGLDFLEAGCKVTFMNEVNGYSVSETCLVHPEGVEVTSEVRVSVAALNNSTK